MRFRIPQYLHKPHQILFMDADEFALVITLFFFALIFGYIFWVLLLVLPYFYFKGKKKYPRGFLKHFLYRLGIIQFKGAPSYFEKRFNE